MTGHELIIQSHSKEPEGVRHWYVSFFFNEGEHTIEISELAAKSISDAFHDLWKSGEITEGLMPGGRAFGLFLRKEQ